MKLIQIGANSGNDHVFNLISEHKSEIELAVFVEPLPFVMDILKNKYTGFANVFFENIGIVNTEDVLLKLFYEKDSSNFEVTSFNYDHVVKSIGTGKEILSIDVPACNINKLFHKYNITQLDHLYIDTEGLDADIIMNIDFSKYKIQHIFFEHAHTDGNWTIGEKYNKVISYLSSNNYDIRKIDALNSDANLGIK